MSEPDRPKRQIQSIEGRTIVMTLSLVGCFYGFMFSVLGFRAARNAQAVSDKAIENQAIYLDRTQLAEKRADKADIRAEYLEEVLKKHFNIQPTFNPE